MYMAINWQNINLINCLRMIIRNCWNTMTKKLSENLKYGMQMIWLAFSIYMHHDKCQMLHIHFILSQHTTFILTHTFIAFEILYSWPAYYCLSSHIDMINLKAIIHMLTTLKGIFLKSVASKKIQNIKNYVPC